jgi:uncharacterized protein YjbJ (UPF0337 family)
MHHWGQVMNDELATIAGKYEELVGRLQERYGIATEETNDQVKDFKKTIGQLKKTKSQLIRMQTSSHTRKSAGRKRAGTRNPSKKTIRPR